MRVLFIGNSHTYFHDMPSTFSRMCTQLTGNRPEVTMLAYSDRDLQWHREEYFSLRFALLYGRYDYCILQQQAHPFPPEENTRQIVDRIIKLCRSVGTFPVIMMTWAMREDKAAAKQMIRFYRELADETGAVMIPVGELFERIALEHPEIDLYWTDGAHASAYGDYLIAAAITAVLLQERDLSALDDQAVDFMLDFEGEDGMPLALEDAEAAIITLDHEKAKVIRALAGGCVHDG